MEHAENKRGEKTLIPSGQGNCASWASQPQKSVTLPPQPGGGDHESSYEHVLALGGKKNFTRQVITRTLSKINKGNSACERMLVDSTWFVYWRIDRSRSVILKKISPKTYGLHCVWFC